jgi:dTDP-glucose pyrophosphorylase
MKILIVAAGKGSRFSKTHSMPKPCIPIDGEYMLVKAAKSLGFTGEHIFIIRENEYRDSLAKKLYEEYPTCKIAVIDFDTEGAAETALVAESLINNDEELVIANCDQIMQWGFWNVDLAVKQLRKFDAGLVTIESSDPKHSYAKVEYNVVTEVQEKNVISDVALTGIHYWKHGSEFVRSAKKMIAKHITSYNGEYYIGPTYNELILDNKKVGIHMISKQAIHFVGTPEDLELYESRKS